MQVAEHGHGWLAQHGGGPEVVVPRNGVKQLILCRLFHTKFQDVIDTLLRHLTVPCLACWP
jgi:hypothetical protein